LRRVKSPGRTVESESKGSVAGEIHSCRPPKTAVLAAMVLAVLEKFEAFEKTRLNSAHEGLKPRHSGLKKREFALGFSGGKQVS